MSGNEKSRRTLIAGIMCFIIGISIGLVVFGWWLWPVQWENANPEQLHKEFQEVYLRMAIDSYAENIDTGLAIQRIEEIGFIGSELLKGIKSNPLRQSSETIEEFIKIGNTEFDYIDLPVKPTREGKVEPVINDFYQVRKNYIEIDRDLYNSRINEFITIKWEVMTNWEAYPALYAPWDVSPKSGSIVATFIDENDKSNLIVVNTNGEVEVAFVTEQIEKYPIPFGYFSPDGNYLATIFGKKHLIIWDSENWNIVADHFFSTDISDITWSPESGRIASLNKKSSLFIFDISEGKITKEFVTSGDPGGYELYWSPAEEVIAINNRHDGKWGIDFFNVDTGQNMKRRDVQDISGGTRIKWSKDGKLLAIHSTWIDQIDIIDVKTDIVVFSSPTDGNGFDLARDFDMVVLSSGIYDIWSGCLLVESHIKPVRTPFGPVTIPHWSPEGNILVTTKIDSLYEEYEVTLFTVGYTRLATESIDLENCPESGENLTRKDLDKIGTVQDRLSSGQISRHEADSEVLNILAKVEHKALGWLLPKIPIYDGEHIVSMDYYFKETLLADECEDEFAETRLCKDPMGTGLDLLFGDIEIGEIESWFGIEE